MLLVLVEGTGEEDAVTHPPEPAEDLQRRWRGTKRVYRNSPPRHTAAILQPHLKADGHPAGR